MRPPSLPDYKSPPLAEVVLGIQFQEIPGYQQICAGQVWDLFKHEYPHVQEQPNLDKQFEFFGTQLQATAPVFRTFHVGPHPRYWFCSANSEMLLQFQQDRLLLNWRRHHDRSIEYPRYESLREQFEAALKTLDQHFKQKFGQGLQINQCEVSYYNTIPFTGKASDWVALFNEAVDTGPEFTLFNRHVCIGPDGVPFARLHLECSAGTTPVNESVIVLNITFRGPPKSDSIEEALKLMDAGRNEIVSRFDGVTTLKAHQEWGKT